MTTPSLLYHSTISTASTPLPAFFFGRLTEQAHLTQEDIKRILLLNSSWTRTCLLQEIGFVRIFDLSVWRVHKLQAHKVYENTESQVSASCHDWRRKRRGSVQIMTAPVLERLWPHEKKKLKQFSPSSHKLTGRTNRQNFSPSLRALTAHVPQAASRAFETHAPVPCSEAAAWIVLLRHFSHVFFHPHKRTSRLLERHLFF